MINDTPYCDLGTQIDTMNEYKTRQETPKHCTMSIENSKETMSLETETPSRRLMLRMRCRMAFKEVLGKPPRLESLFKPCANRPQIAVDLSWWLSESR